ncbi:MAG: GlxA family transcriptional regulator [Pseudomonadota bacterium]
MFDPDPSVLEIEVLVAPETTLMLFASIVEPLRAANRTLGRRIYRWRMSSFDGAPVETASGVTIPVAGPFRAEGTAPLFVAASYHPEDHLTSDIQRRLGQAASTRPMIGAVEAGTWFIAHAGLLNGYRATTHWEDLDAFASRFPEIEVVGRRFLRDRNRFTSAGSGPTLDLMIDLIRTRQGEARALDVARLLNYEPGLDQPWKSVTRPGIRDPKVARAVWLMDETLDEPVSVAEIARQTGLSTRQLQARFQTDLGAGPKAHYLGLRLGAARRLLIETREPVVDIAAATGFSSPAVFSRAYRRQHGESPSETRAQVMK